MIFQGEDMLAERTEKLKWRVYAFSLGFWQKLDTITAVFSVSGVVFNTDL